MESGAKPVSAKSVSLVTPNGEPPLLIQLGKHLRACLDLCDALEQIADRLPENLQCGQCLEVARSIYPTVKQSHEFEEASLFPLLIDESRPDEKTRMTIQRLHAEHWEDESFAFEVRDALMEFASNPRHSNVEALGYMLRGFFEGVRRHVAFEWEHVVPALRNNLSGGATANA